MREFISRIPIFKNVNHKTSGHNSHVAANFGICSYKVVSGIVFLFVSSITDDALFQP